jgi:hypothetical protein
MKAYGRVEIQLHLLTSAIDGYEWSVLTLEKETSVPTGWETGWAAEPVWSLWRRGKFLASAEYRIMIPQSYSL